MVPNDRIVVEAISRAGITKKSAARRWMRISQDLREDSIWLEGWNANQNKALGVDLSADNNSGTCN